KIMKKILEVTGLKEQQVASVVKGLSGLLADLQVYYSNLRGFHWNIRGAEFFVLHEQYEKMYDDLAGKIDEVAERILQLGGKPENRFSEYLKVAEVKEEH
ncbi:ferritin-like domain-containing protein, partial [Enterococcus faecalis]|nr:ferritin-like domain-containing protein [Enterococcus faecalis]